MQAVVDTKHLDTILKGMEKAAAMEAAAIKYLEEKNGKPYPCNGFQPMIGFSKETQPCKRKK